VFRHRIVCRNWPSGSGAGNCDLILRIRDDVSVTVRADDAAMNCQRSGVFLVRAWTEGHGFRARISCVGDDGRPPTHEVTADADEVGRILHAWVIALRDSQHRTDCMPRGSGNVQAQNRESDVIDFALRRAQNLAPGRLTVDKMARAARNGISAASAWQPTSSLAW
jgi:hypothetical protein